MGRTGIYACGESVSRHNSSELVVLFSLKQEASASIGGGTFTLPTDGVAILLGIDRILDMIRTICNVCGNCMATVVVARWEHELTKETFIARYADFIRGKLKSVS